MRPNLMLLGLLVSLSVCCPDKDPYCAFCNGPVCIYCVASYPNSVGKCQVPKSLIDNCIAYKNEDACRSCKFGYTLSNNKCIKIPIENCFEAVDGTCSFCDKNILQVNGQCPLGKTCTDPNCSLCKISGGAEVCGLCKPGYTLQVTGTSYRCLQEYDSNRNCLRVFNEDSSKCAVCDINYYWVNAHCEKSPAYYIDYLPQASTQTKTWSLWGWLFGN